MIDNEPAIAEALASDLGRKPFEAWLTDVAPTAGEAKDAAKNVGKWMRRKCRLLELSQLPARGWIEYEPYGTVLIIGAWNFPFVLDARPRRRRHRRREHRRPQAVRGDTGLLGVDGRIGSAVSGSTTRSR